jgi:hypothetical protein
METYQQKHFIHVDADAAGQTVAGWLNGLTLKNTILEWQMVPVGHGVFVVARCVPLETEDEVSQRLMQSLPIAWLGGQQ